MNILEGLKFMVMVLLPLFMGCGIAEIVINRNKIKSFKDVIYAIIGKFD
ncbi:MAG: hypothetical protein KBT06_05510 [Prevotellaceae bacterium]|nr:hypothetical protein [Candidatus Colivivens equi]